MIIDIFERFDPSTLSGWGENWVFIGIFIPIFSYKYIITPRQIYLLYKGAKRRLYGEREVLLSLKIKSRKIIVLTCFIVIFWNNFTSLLPFTFNTTRHWRISISLALPIFRMVVLVNYTTNLNNALTHITPRGTPTLIIPLIIIIEFIRTIIRPVTLSVRLYANIIAGHLLISVMSNCLNLSTLLTQIPLLTLELIVSLIQAYVFTALVLIYISEID